MTSFAAKFVLGIGFLTAAVSFAGETERQEAKALREYRGTTPETVDGPIPDAVIFDATSYEAAWKKLNLKESPGPVSFANEIVYLATTRGSRMGFRLRDEGEGRLGVSAIATRDIRPGLRYIFGVFSKKDWKEINGVGAP